jgi:SHS2 domain-containing protein
MSKLSFCESIQVRCTGFHQSTPAEKYGILPRRMQPEFGFREHAHTADWELEVWAPDLPCLLEQAARGMYSLSGVELKARAAQECSINLHAGDAESLLVRFLTELLWLQQEKQLGFDRFSIRVDNNYNLQARLVGAPILKFYKEIKAVTYHNLAVQTTSQGLRVNIVFDV